MIFNFSDTPPKGTKKYIKPEEYLELDDQGKYCYSPEYLQYRAKKTRNYSECDCCGHKEFIGWIETKVPIGEPYRYSWTYKIVPYTFYKQQIDSLLNSNTLMIRALGKWDRK